MTPGNRQCYNVGAVARLPQCIYSGAADNDNGHHPPIPIAIAIANLNYNRAVGKAGAPAGRLELARRNDPAGRRFGGVPRHRLL